MTTVVGGGIIIHSRSSLPARALSRIVIRTLVFSRYDDASLIDPPRTVSAKKFRPDSPLAILVSFFRFVDTDGKLVCRSVDCDEDDAGGSDN